ncbi:MAG: formate dehydrogenase subunit delta [Rhodospirillaceae bacterium]|nr:formate dehydrogenase subunit delta [Rhodospirillaceae bacterium]
MANQIGKAFAYQDEAASVASIAGHIRSFWEPRMKKAILAYEQAGGTGLDSRVLAAVRSLRPAQ